MRRRWSVVAAGLVLAAWGARAETAPDLPPHARLAVEETLAWTGDYVGAIDGALGPKLRAALQHFRERAGLLGKSQLGPEVLRRLDATRRELRRTHGLEFVLDAANDLAFAVPRERFTEAGRAARGRRFATRDGAASVESFSVAGKDLGKAMAEAAPGFTALERHAGGERGRLLGTHGDERALVAAQRVDQQIKGLVVRWRAGSDGATRPLAEIIAASLDGLPAEAAREDEFAQASFDGALGDDGSDDAASNEPDRIVFENGRTEGRLAAGKLAVEAKLVTSRAATDGKAATPDGTKPDGAQPGDAQPGDAKPDGGAGAAAGGGAGEEEGEGSAAGDGDAAGDGGEDHIALTVTLDGAKVVELAGDAALSTFYVGTVAIRELDPSNDLPEVIVATYSGGAHCCTEFTVFSKDAAGGFRRIEAGSFDGDGDYVQDYDGDGVYEIAASDTAFLYAFDSYAASFAPLKILRIEKAAVVDASREPRFRVVQRERLNDMWGWAKLDGSVPTNGFLAGFVAQASLIGERDEAWSFMQAHYDHDSDWGMESCAVEVKDGAECPEGKTVTRTFPEALASFLSARGY